MTFLFQVPQPADYVGGSWSNLEITPNAAAYQTKFEIRSFRGISGDGSFHFNITSILIVNSGTIGANGIDTGALAANKNYYIWVIGDSNGIKANAGLLSLKNGLNGNPTMPTGYDKKRLVGSITTDATPHFRPIRKVNDLVFLCDPYGYVNTSSSFVEANMDIGPYTSYFARKALLNTFINTSGSVDANARYQARATYFAPTNYQYDHYFLVNVSGADSGYGYDSNSGWVDLEADLAADPPVVNFSHVYTCSGAVFFGWLVGFQEILPQ